MNNFYITNTSVDFPVESTSPKIDFTRNTTVKPAKRKKLSMIWVKEFDGKDYRLTAKWVSD